MKLMCWLRGHSWTCAAEQGITPSNLQIEVWQKDKTFSGFYDYAKMYCSRCGKIHELSLINLARSRSTGL